MTKFFATMLILFAGNAFAAEVFENNADECTAKTRGILQCMAGKQCECTYIRPSLMKNDPGGYRWDCGILKPNCIDPNKISDRENAKPYDGPDSVFIER